MIADLSHARRFIGYPTDRPSPNVDQQWALHLLSPKRPLTCLTYSTIPAISHSQSQEYVRIVIKQYIDIVAVCGWAANVT